VAERLSAFTSSPILVGDTIYEVSETGELCSVDAETGKIRWRLKIGIEQRNSSLLYADGKLYVPLLEDPQVKGKGAFFVVRPGEKTGELLSHIQLEGRCFGSPTIYNGKVYVQSSEKLYCFGDKNAKPARLPKQPALSGLSPAWPPTFRSFRRKCCSPLGNQLPFACANSMPTVWWSKS
jgi:outer membrane protein assembly factor BamB